MWNIERYQGSIFFFFFCFWMKQQGRVMCLNLEGDQVWVGDSIGRIYIFHQRVFFSFLFSPWLKTKLRNIKSFGLLHSFVGHQGNVFCISSISSIKEKRMQQWSAGKDRKIRSWDSEVTKHNFWASFKLMKKNLFPCSFFFFDFARPITAHWNSRSMTPFFA